MYFLPPPIVIKHIKQCRYIASSSLHGLIIADAYHIPNVRLVDYSTFHWKDADYKYEDYYSALGIEDSPHIITGRESKEEIIAMATMKPVEKINEIQKQLDAVLKKFSNNIKKRK